MDDLGDIFDPGAFKYINTGFELVKTLAGDGRTAGEESEKVEKEEEKVEENSISCPWNDEELNKKIWKMDEDRKSRPNKLKNNIETTRKKLIEVEKGFVLALKANDDNTTAEPNEALQSAEDKVKKAVVAMVEAQNALEKKLLIYADSHLESMEAAEEHIKKVDAEIKKVKTETKKGNELNKLRVLEECKKNTEKTRVSFKTAAEKQDAEVDNLKRWRKEEKKALVKEGKVSDNFDADGVNEMSVKAGDVVRIVEEEQEGWVKVKVKVKNSDGKEGEEGNVPYSYVKWENVEDAYIRQIKERPREKFQPLPAFESREQPAPPAPSEELSLGKEAAAGAGEAAALRRGLSTKSGWSESAAEP